MTKNQIRCKLSINLLMLLEELLPPSLLLLLLLLLKVVSDDGDDIGLLLPHAQLIESARVQV